MTDDPMSKSIPPDLRRARIVEEIQRDGGKSIAELARTFGVSPITVHRDLKSLADKGVIRRVRGGARHADDRESEIDTQWSRRLRRAWELKTSIGVTAVRCIDDGATIFVDHSTTGLALAREIQRQPPNELTLVTNSPAISLQFSAPSVHLVVTPGEVDQDLRMIGGPWTREFLSQLNFTIAFVSGIGFSPLYGLTTSRRPIADTLRAALSVSSRRIALVDSTKLGNVSLLPIALPNELDVVVVDAGASPEILSGLQDATITVLVAPGESTPMPVPVRTEPPE